MDKIKNVTLKSIRSDKKHQHCKKFESVTSNIGLGNNSGNKGQTDEHDT